MEIEAKFTIPDAATFERLMQASTLADMQAGPVGRKHVHDRYLDTADRRFMRNGFACRVRDKGDGWLATLKGLGTGEGALHRRAELEVNLPASELNIQDWPAGEVREVALRLSAGQPLELVFEMWQERNVRLLQSQSREEPVIELSLDVVHRDREDSVPWFELEGELLPAGSVQQLEALMQTLAGHWGLVPESRSKFERGLPAADAALLAQLRA
jgi:inorganic triphosphatase YgiF